MIIPFDKFWAIYPRRVAKGQARRAWQKLDPGKCDPPLTEIELWSKIELAIQAQKIYRQKCRKELPDWKYPATWLNSECWEDEIPSLSDGHAARQTVRIDHKENPNDWRKVMGEQYLAKHGLLKQPDETVFEYTRRLREHAKTHYKDLGNLMQ